MALSRDQVVDAAMTILHNYGLSSLSMRNLATDLGVQPGALYWHVKSKQDLLVLLAERILATPMKTLGSTMPGAAVPKKEAEAAAHSVGVQTREVALQIREALTSVKDGAEVVSVAQALNPEPLGPLRQLRDTLPAGLTPRQAEWAARALTHYILGAVVEEQNHVDFTMAGVATGHQSTAYTTEAFLFGIDAFLGGINSVAADSGKGLVTPQP
jgi:AcrR family transcriptional regulator